MMKKILSLAGKTAVGEKAISDPRFRTVLFSCISLGINLSYSLYNGIVGIIYSSFWFITLFAYYTILSAMRFYAVTYELRSTDKRTEYSVMRFCGICLCFLAIVISGMVCLNIASDRNASKHMVLMITIATYTFWKASVAIVNSIKVRRKGSPLLITLRNINCADAAVSMLALEHSMIATFGDGEYRFALVMDAATGAAAFLTIILLGIGMVIKSTKCVSVNRTTR